MQLGAAVREARIGKDVSQEKLAELASLSKNYIGNIERGEYDVTVSVLGQVAAALDCKASDLLRSANL
jgi:transcriptional regulator with XRE-family HTH domain